MELFASSGISGVWQRAMAGQWVERGRNSEVVVGGPRGFLCINAKEKQDGI